MTPPASTPSSPAPGARAVPVPVPVPASDTLAEDLDLEEDVAPNLGGEDQMQDA